MNSPSSMFGGSCFGNSPTAVPVTSNTNIFGASREAHHRNGFSSATASPFGSRPASHGLFGGMSAFGSPGAPDAAERTGTTDGFGQGGSIFRSGSIHGTKSSPAKVVKASTASLRVADDQALDLGADILTFKVGQDEHERTFTIHKNLIDARSPYIKNEATTATICFPSISQDAFALYLQLLYTNRLPSKSIDAVKEYSLYVLLYNLASELQDLATKNVALDAILSVAKEGSDIPTGEHIRIIYGASSGLCAARRLMVDLYKFRATKQVMEGQSFPPEFLSDLAASMVANREVSTGRAGGGCRRITMRSSNM